MTDIVERLRARAAESDRLVTHMPNGNAELCSEAAQAIEELRRERDEARQIVRDIHWMAVRYADGRKSYAPGMLNDALRKAYGAGWLTYTRSPEMRDLDPQYARDGDEAEYRSIEERVTRLRDALKPFGQYLDSASYEVDNNGNPLPDEQGMGWVYLTVGDFRRARAALQDKGGTA